ncbi:hypothetical protein AAY473_033687 [Plecturocebus cupreus]
MGPAEPVRPAHSAPGSTAPGAGKRAAPAKRVAPATRVASPPGISRSVGNKNSSEKGCCLMTSEYVAAEDAGTAQLWLAKEKGEEERGKAKYRLVQALKAVIRLAAAMAHPGRLAGKGTSFIQRVSGQLLSRGTGTHERGAPLRAITTSMWSPRLPYFS